MLGVGGFEIGKSTLEFPTFGSQDLSCSWNDGGQQKESSFGWKTKDPSPTSSSSFSFGWQSVVEQQQEQPQQQQWQAKGRSYGPQFVQPEQSSKDVNPWNQLSSQDSKGFVTNSPAASFVPVVSSSSSSSAPALFEGFGSPKLQPQTSTLSPLSLSRPAIAATELKPENRRRLKRDKLPSVPPTTKATSIQINPRNQQPQQPQPPPQVAIQKPKPQPQQQQYPQNPQPQQKLLLLQSHKLESRVDVDPFGLADFRSSEPKKLQEQVAPGQLKKKTIAPSSVALIHTMKTQPLFTRTNNNPAGESLKTIEWMDDPSTAVAAAHPPMSIHLLTKSGGPQSRPPFSQLMEMTRAQLSQVENFTLMFFGLGQITWHGSSDLSDLKLGQDLANIVKLDVHHVEVLHPRFKNKPARVILKNCWPSSKDNHNVLVKYINRLKRLAESWQGEFRSYNSKNGEWTLDLFCAKHMTVTTEDNVPNKKPLEKDRDQYRLVCKYENAYLGLDHQNSLWAWGTTLNPDWKDIFSGPQRKITQNILNIETKYYGFKITNEEDGLFDTTQFIVLVGGRWSHRSSEYWHCVLKDPLIFPWYILVICFGILVFLKLQPWIIGSGFYYQRNVNIQLGETLNEYLLPLPRGNHTLGYYLHVNKTCVEQQCVTIATMENNNISTFQTTFMKTLGTYPLYPNRHSLGSNQTWLGVVVTFHPIFLRKPIVYATEIYKQEGKFNDDTSWSMYFFQSMSFFHKFWLKDYWLLPKQHHPLQIQYSPNLKWIADLDFPT